MRILTILVCWAVLLLPTMSDANAQDMERTSSHILGQLKKNNIRSIAVLNFVDINGRVRGLGKYLAEELSISMVGNDAGIRVVDRANLNRIMEELRLSESVLVNPKNAKRLGDMSGADALLFGTLVKTDRAYNLQLRGVSVGTAEVLAAARVRLNLGEDFRGLWESMLGTGSASSVQPGSDRPHREYVQSNGRFEVTLLNMAAAGPGGGNSGGWTYDKRWNLSIAFIAKNLTDSSISLQFQYKDFLVYHGQDGAVCAEGFMNQGIRSNLPVTFRADFDHSNVQVVGPREELMVNVSGLRCSERPKMNKGYFAIRMKSASEANGYNNENFSFRDVEIALGK